jgi:hypothetical protein
LATCGLISTIIERSQSRLLDFAAIQGLRFPRIPFMAETIKAALLTLQKEIEENSKQEVSKSQTL